MLLNEFYNAFETSATAKWFVYIVVSINSFCTPILYLFFPFCKWNHGIHLHFFLNKTFTLCMCVILPAYKTILLQAPGTGIIFCGKTTFLFNGSCRGRTGLSAQYLGNGLHNQYVSMQGIYLIDHQLSQDREAINHTWWKGISNVNHLPFSNISFHT